MDGKVKLDNGLAYDAAPEVVVAFENLQKKAGELQAKLDEVTAAKDAAEGTRDELKAKVAELEKKDNAEEIRQGVKERIRVEDIARKALSEEAAKKLDGMSNDEIVKAVVQSKNEKLDLEGKSHDYLMARFDAIAEGLGNEQHKKNSEALRGDGSRKDGEADEDTARSKAIGAMKRRSRGQEEEKK